MALIKCKDCGNNISKQALFCPQCGRAELACGFAVWLMVIYAALVVLITVLL